MSQSTRVLLFPIDVQTAQIVSASLADVDSFSVEVASKRRGNDSSTGWDAVIVCADGNSLPEKELLDMRAQFGFCPLVVVGSGDPPSSEPSLAPGVMTLSASEFSAHALRSLLRAAGELRTANVKLVGLEATARIKSDLLARQNELIQNLTSRLCHEVRSPLTAARQFTSLIARGHVEDVPGTASRALRSLDDLSMLVDDMSALCQWEVPCRGLHRKVTSVNDITGEIEHLLRERARVEGIEFEIRIDGELPLVFADPDAVGQAIRNLVVNSLQHAGQRQRVKLWAEADSGGVIIGIEDQFGCIDPAEAEEAFDEFCKADISLMASSQGRHRGLAVARRLLQSNMSELRLESLGDHGSVFVFQLPGAEATSLIPRYLAFVRTTRPCTSLSLLTFSTDNTARFSPAPAIDDFLQTSVSADDLVFQCGPLEWTALLCGNRHETAGRLRLLDAMWAARRERDQWLDLPAVHWQQHGNWSSELHGSTIATEFLKRCGIEAPISPRVLVVDNHHERLLRLSYQLGAAGYDVLVARDSTEGISSAAANHPDAIVWNAGSDEVAAMQEMQRQDAGHVTPVIMLATNMRQQQQALSQGAKTVLDQSLRTTEVVQAVQRSLAEHVTEPRGKQPSRLEACGT